MTYYTRYILPLPCRDGYTRRVLIKRRSSHSEAPWSAETIMGLVDPLVIQWGHPGGDDLYTAVPPNTAELRLYDRVMLDLASAGPDAWQVVLEVQIGSEWIEEWHGYARPERIRYDVYEHGVVIPCDAGFRLLKDRAHEQDGPEPAVKSIAKMLAHIGMDGGLFTRMTWAPYTPLYATSETDQLWAIHTRDEAWKTSQHESRELSVLQAIAGRFLLRVFQSQGAWYAVQRTSLPKPSTGDSDEVYMWHYASHHDFSASATRQPVSLLYDASGVAQRRGVQAESKARTRLVTCNYDFYPDLDEIILNGSFEDPDETDAILPLHWGVAGGAERVNLSDLTDTGLDFDPVNTNQYVLRIPGKEGSTGDAYAEQSGQIYIPASNRYSLQLSYMYAVPFPPGNEDRAEAVVEVKVGDHHLHLAYVMVTAAAIKGDDVELYIRPFLSPPSGVGASHPPGDYVVGTPIIPAGTALDNRTHRFRLTRDLKIGDTIAFGSLSDDITPTANGFRVYFWATEPHRLRHFSQVAGMQSLSGHTYMVDIDGKVVYGPLSVRLEDWSWDQNDNIAPNYYTIFDAVRMAIKADGSSVGAIAWQTSAPAHAYGQEEHLADRVIGDGPSLDSATRMMIMDRHGGLQDLALGSDGGWKEAAYEPPEDDPSGRTIDALTARIVLQEEIGALQRIATTLIFRGRRPYAPHQVLGLEQSQKIVYQASSGAYYLAVQRRIRPGTAITIGSETHTVTELSGEDPFVIYLDGTLSQTYPAGTRVKWRADYWWDRLEWNVQAGEVYFEGTELWRDTTSPIVEQIMTAG